MKQSKTASTATTSAERRRAVAGIAQAIEKHLGPGCGSTNERDAIEIIEKAINLTMDGLHVDLSTRAAGGEWIATDQEIECKVKEILGLLGNSRPSS